MAGQRWRRAVAAAGVLVVIGACAAEPSTEEERRAQDLVFSLLDSTAMNTYSQDIDEFARAADAASSSETTLVGMERSGSGDTLGHLTFAVRPADPTDTRGSGMFQPSRDWDAGPYCFRAELDPHGKTGDSSTMDGIDMVDCPDDITALVPPLSTEPVVASGAREAAHEVLGALPSSGTLVEDDVAAEINALLPTEVEGRPVSQAEAFVDGSDVGVAMGGPDDCVLVARIGGSVIDIYPPAVSLQPGEMGCGPGTALTPDLRPPH